MPPSNALLVEGEYNSVHDSSSTRHKPMQWKIINELYRHFLTDQMQFYQRYFSWVRIAVLVSLTLWLSKRRYFHSINFFVFWKHQKCAKVTLLIMLSVISIIIASPQSTLARYRVFRSCEFQNSLELLWKILTTSFIFLFTWFVIIIDFDRNWLDCSHIKLSFHSKCGTKFIDTRNLWKTQTRINILL